MRRKQKGPKWNFWD